MTELKIRLKRTRHNDDGIAQLIARLHAASVPAQPFAVDEVRAGELEAHSGAAKAANRLAVEGVSGLTLAHQRP